MKRASVGFEKQIWIWRDSTCSSSRVLRKYYPAGFPLDSSDIIDWWVVQL